MSPRSASPRRGPPGAARPRSPTPPPRGGLSGLQEGERAVTAAESAGIVEGTRRFFRTRRPVGVASGYVFGSRARGDAHRESDLNVGVVFDREVLPDPDARSTESIDLASELIGAVHLNDVQVISLLVVCQAVIDIAGELASRRGRRFQDYTEAIRALSEYDEFPDELVRSLTRLPGFRNVLVHGDVDLDYGRVLEAIRDLGPVEEFARAAARLEEEAQGEAG